MVIIIGLIVIFGGSIYGFTHAGGKLVSLIHLSEIVRSKHGRSNDHHAPARY